MPEVDLSEFVKLSLPKRKFPPCQVATARVALSEEEQAQLDGASVDDRISAGAIQTWLGDRKLELSVPGITSHRKQKCACFQQ